jgi:hypothetical protein
MGQYTNKGLLNGYNKNNTEREELDYYATPAAEVVNILETLDYDFTFKTILEPCIGGGHMVAGIQSYLTEHGQKPDKCYGTDYKDRGFRSNIWEIQYGLDTLADDYPYDSVDVVIMNPPYSTIEPFLIRALDIAKDVVIVLCRTQVLEGASRYEKIFKDNPPTHIFSYVDRIQCWKGGKKPTGSSAQMYSWLVWEKGSDSKLPTWHWIRRSKEY